MSTATTTPGQSPQSAIARSPFPPSASARHLGNFPQVFSHLALIEAAGRIILSDRLEEFT